MSENFVLQYQCLAELKEIDERAFLIERDSERIPEEIRVQDEALAARRNDLDTVKAQVTEGEKRLRAAERELKEKEDSLFKAEGKMMEVKTNQEYQAAIKENEAQKAAKALLEERVLVLINEMEEQKKALVGIETEFKTYETMILQQKKKLNDEHQALMKQLEVVLRQRKELTSKLDPSVATMYLKGIALGRTAVAATEHGRCLSCNMQVRAQIYNEILGHKAIHRCPSCGRILIVPARVASASEAEMQAK